MKIKNHHFIILFISFLIATSSNAISEQLEKFFDKGNEYARQGLWDDAIDAYEQSIKLNPEMAKVHYNLSRALFYKRLEVIDNNRKRELFKFFSNSSDPNIRPENNIIEGESESTRNLLKKEIQELQVSIKLDDKNAMAHYFLGTHYHNVENLIEAEAHLKRAIELEPSYSNSYGVLASVYEKMENYSTAINLYNEVLRIDPEYDGTHRDLALLYHKMGMTKEALKEYELLKKKDSSLVNGLKQIFEP